MRYEPARYEHTCPGCQGCGATPCGGCDGIGHVANAPSDPAMSPSAVGEAARHTCPVCHGAGAVRCQLCHGKGTRGPVAASRFV